MWRHGLTVRLGRKFEKNGLLIIKKTFDEAMRTASSLMSKPVSQMNARSTMLWYFYKKNTMLERQILINHI